ncbi:MAG: hypothetical protein GOU99_02840 [Candidatus Altiarchaeota archaeon]|nr:hypothetical protein [Candidatus Altiarchaeota archaeon]
MEFIDVYAGQPGVDKRKRADWLGTKIAPGHFSLLISTNHSQIRKQRHNYELVTAIAKSKTDTTSLLTDTYYDFLIIPPLFRLGKRGARMARRYEVALAVPLAPVFLMDVKTLRRTSYNLRLIQANNTKLVLCSGADSASQLRGGRELAAIGALLGLRPEVSISAVREVPASLLAKSKKRLGQKAPGVTSL